MRLSHGGLSLYELSAALRHILESYMSQRPQHNKQTMPPTSPASNPGGMAGKRTVSSKGLVGNTNANINPPCQLTRTAATPATATESLPSSSASAIPRATTNAASTLPRAIVSTEDEIDRNVTIAKGPRDPIAVTSRRSAAPERAATTNAADASVDVAALDQPPSSTTVQDGKTRQRGNESATGGGTAPVRDTHQGQRVAFAESHQAPTKLIDEGSAGASNSTSSAAGAGQVSAVRSTAGGGAGKESSGSATGAEVKHPPDGGGKKPDRGDKAAEVGKGSGAERAPRPAFAEQDWRSLEPDLMQFCYKVLRCQGARVSAVGIPWFSGTWTDPRG